MSDPIRIACPHCQKSLRVRSEYLGKKVQCNQCGQTFTIATPGDGDLSTDESRGQPDTKTAALKNELDAMKAEAESLRSQLSVLQAEDSRQNRKLETSEAAAETHRLDAEVLRGQLAEEKTGSAAEIASLRRELDEAHRGWVAERQSIESDWMARHGDARADAARLREESGAVHRELDQAHAEMDRLKHRLDAETDHHGDEARELKAESEALAARFETISGGLEAERARSATLLSELEGARTQLEHRDGEMERLRNLVSEAECLSQEQSRLAETLRSELESERRERAVDRERPIFSDTEKNRHVAALAESLVGLSHDPEIESTPNEGIPRDRSALESELAENAKTIDDLKSQLLQANDFRQQMRTFLAGLGIKLPG